MSVDLPTFEKALNDITSRKALAKIFTRFLNYQYVGRKYDSPGLQENFPDQTPPVELLVRSGEFYVLLIEDHEFNKIDQLRIIKHLARQAPNALFIFESIKNRYTLIQLRTKPESTRVRDMVRRFELRPEEVTRTIVQQLSELEVEDTDTPINLSLKLERAFSVEMVTERFFEEYKRRFDELKSIVEQKADEQTAYEFAQRLLNRYLFLYFLQKMGWMRGPENPKQFMHEYWREYRKTGQTNLFYQNWLRPLFFQALNNRNSSPF